jgi:hypothetical protein
MHYVCCHCGKGISQTRPKPIPVVVHMSQCCQYTCAKHTCNSHIQYSYFDMYGYLGKQGTTQSTVVLSAHVNISVCKLPPYMWMHVHNYIKDTWEIKHAIHTCMHACHNLHTHCIPYYCWQQLLLLLLLPLLLLLLIVLLCFWALK